MGKEMMSFTRFSETLKTKGNSKVTSLSVKLTVTDCTGAIYYTDIQLQEGDRLTGYTLNNKTMLKKATTGTRHYNGIIRSGDTIVLINTGKVSTGLDIEINPLQAMKQGSISLSQGAGAHGVTLKSAVNAGDNLCLLASQRKCTQNGIPTPKDGFYQYTASGDSKHKVKLQDGKSARLLFTFDEMTEGSSAK